MSATINFFRAFNSTSFSHLLNALTHTVLWTNPYTGFPPVCRDKCSALNNLMWFPPTFSINFGVPEGSILGPVISNIFSDSLLQLLPPDRTVAYADNYTLISHGDSLTSASAAMQLLLQSVSNWADGHGMFINTEKCFVMYISPVLKGKKAQH